MSKHTNTLVGDEARRALKKGIDAVALPVMATAGPKGRNACYRDPVMPTVTNDGVSIARRVRPEDPFESIGADLVKQAAEKTNQEAGDGTTSSIVLTQALVKKGLEELGKGIAPMILKAELEKSKDKAIEILKKNSRPADDILAVAKISVEDEKAAQKVAEATKKAGKRGVVTVEEGAGNEIELDEAKGYHWERGFISRYFANTERGECILEDVPVITTDRYMNRNGELIGVLGQLKKEGYNRAMIIVDRMEGEILQTLIVNKQKGVFDAVVVTRPPADAELEDIAFLTNGTAIIKEKGIREIGRPHVGFVKRVVVTEDRTLIIAEDTPGLQARIKQLEEELKGKKEEGEITALKSRLAKLSDGFVLLRAGAKTEAEMRYLAAKLVDAACACRAAVEEGVVKGGGLALYEASGQVGGLLGEVMKRPFEVIMKNAGLEIDPKHEGGYNVLTGEKVADMFASGIVDPLKVVRCSLENAVSLASMVLTIESVVAVSDPKSPIETS
jgi:chaperonin GroEL